LLKFNPFCSKFSPLSKTQKRFFEILPVRGGIAIASNHGYTYIAE